MVNLYTSFLSKPRWEIREKYVAIQQWEDVKFRFQGDRDQIWGARKATTPGAKEIFKFLVYLYIL